METNLLHVVVLSRLLTFVGSEEVKIDVWRGECVQLYWRVVILSSLLALFQPSIQRSSKQFGYNIVFDAPSCVESWTWLRLHGSLYYVSEDGSKPRPALHTLCQYFGVRSLLYPWT